MFTLIKLSGDGWEKAFNTEQETAEELSKWVCKGCRKQADGNLYELLATDCGAEFMLEEEETLDELLEKMRIMVDASPNPLTKENNNDNHSNLWP